MTARALQRSCVAVASILLGIGGCSSDSHPAPSFRVVEARVEDVSPDQPGASVVAFYLEGENTSRDTIPLRDIRFTATVDGKSVEVRRGAEATLSRLSTRRIRIPAAFDAQSFSAGAAYSVSGIVRYAAQGAFSRTLYDAGWVDHSVAFSGSGTLAEAGQAPVTTPITPVTTDSRPTLRPRQPVGAPAEKPPEKPPEKPGEAPAP